MMMDVSMVFHWVDHRSKFRICKFLNTVAELQVGLFEGLWCIVKE